MENFGKVASRGGLVHLRVYEESATETLIKLLTSSNRSSGPRQNGPVVRIDPLDHRTQSLDSVLELLHEQVRQSAHLPTTAYPASTIAFASNVRARGSIDIRDNIIVQQIDSATVARRVETLIKSLIEALRRHLATHDYTIVLVHADNYSDNCYQQIKRTLIDSRLSPLMQDGLVLLEIFGADSARYREREGEVVPDLSLDAPVRVSELESDEAREDISRALHLYGAAPSADVADYGANVLLASSDTVRNLHANVNRTITELGRVL